MKKDQGWLAASTEASAANSHSLASLRLRRSAGHQSVAQIAEVEQDRAAFENRDIAVGQPRHLAEGLMGEMLALRSRNGVLSTAIGQPASSSASAPAGRAHSPSAALEPNRRW